MKYLVYDHFIQTNEMKKISVIKRMIAFFKQKKTISYRLGDYQKNVCCNQCDWFLKNMKKWDNICPKCGGQQFSLSVGRPKIKTTHGFFIVRKIEYIDFVKKQQ